MMNSQTPAGSRPRPTRLSSNAWTVAAFSVAPSTRPSGCFSPRPSMPTAATRIRSSRMCRPSIWMASRSSCDRSETSHCRSFVLDRATNLRDTADLEVPSPGIEPTSPPGSRTERRNLRVETLISIWFIAHWPSQSSSCAAAQLGSTSSCWPSRLRTRGRSTPTPMKDDRAPGLAASHAADGARRTAPPLPPAEVPEALRSRRSGRICRSFSELPRSHGRPVVRHRGWIQGYRGSRCSHILFHGVAPRRGTPSLRAQGEQLPLRFAPSTGISPYESPYERSFTMQSLVAVAQFSILVLAAAIFLGLLVAYYVGGSLAARQPQLPPGEAADIGHIVTGMLGLLAF